MEKEDNDEKIYYKPDGNWCWVYILKSKKDQQCYIGSTNDLQRRFKEHNDGKIFSTANRKPLILVYYEAFRSEKDARKREQALKNYGQGITNLYKRISNSLIV